VCSCIYILWVNVFYVRFKALTVVTLFWGVTPYNPVVPINKLSCAPLFKKFLAHLWNLKCYYHVHKNFSLDLIMGRWIQYTSPHPIYLEFILIRSSHLCLGLSRCFFPLVFPNKILYASLHNLMHAMADLSRSRWSDHPPFDGEYRLWTT
jgi:hypothetical protein